MGCAASKPAEEDDNVVTLCRERKRLMKSAVERRRLVADAHSKYSQSLYAVALAVRLFVACHSSESPPPFLITFSQPSEASDEVQQMPSQATQTHETFACESPVDTASASSRSSNLEREEGGGRDAGDGETEICAHFYGGSGTDPPMPSSRTKVGWDFFNPFDEVRTQVGNGFYQSSDDYLTAVREAEGIPELEEVEERESFRERKAAKADDGDAAHEEDQGGGAKDLETVGDANLSQGERSGVQVIDSPRNGRELLEALKDVEDHFIRVYDSGVGVAKMLETNTVHLQAGMEETKENSKKIIQSITWRRSTSWQSSSCKSFLASSSKSSSMWTESRNDLFDEYGGMESGIHSSTLERLYAWEKKLYEEVKAGEQTRKIYERKCSQFRKQDAGNENLISMDKNRAEVRDLHSRILVAIRSAESISKRIQKLRDEELQPQLVELLHGLMKTWKITLESHETQNRTMFEVRSFTCPVYGKFCNDAHRIATFKLEAELQNWRSCFAAYTSAQKAYVEVLNRWLSKFITHENEIYPKSKSSDHPCQVNQPPLLATCHNWLASMEKLPVKSVIYSLKSFEKDIHSLLIQQGEEQQQKRKVDGLTKELDRRVLVLQRAECKILDSKLSEQTTQVDMRHRIECLAERKGQLDVFKRRLDTERAKHHDSMQETLRITLNGFQIGFSSVFESLVEFSKASANMYADLVAYCKHSMVER